MENRSQRPRVAIIPIPAMGHIIPLTEFARRLQLASNFSVTFIVPSYALSATILKPFLQALPAGMDVVHLPPPDYDDIPASASINARFELSLTRSVPAIHDSLKALAESTSLVALVVDVVCTDAIEAATEIGVPKYVFFPAAAMCLFLLLNSPRMSESYDSEQSIKSDTFKLLGIQPVHRRDLPRYVNDQSGEAPEWILGHSQRYRQADGIILNSFEDLEPGAFKALADKEFCGPPVFSIGPVIRPRQAGGAECLSWLDRQPSDSVLYVSFGSSGQLSAKQITELAWGLELSQQKFLWVLSIPYAPTGNAFDLLPEGFIERTRHRGLAVPTWAPQMEILSHGSTGGFLSHCGWNSVLESVCHGVPITAWPMLGDQMINAAWLSRDLGVATRVGGQNGFVGREEIAEHVRDLIVGEKGKKLRSKMRELKLAASVALGPDGSASKSLAQLTEKLSN